MEGDGRTDPRSSCKTEAPAIQQQTGLRLIPKLSTVFYGNCCDTLFFTGFAAQATPVTASEISKTRGEKLILERTVVVRKDEIAEVRIFAAK